MVSETGQPETLTNIQGEPMYIRQQPSLKQRFTSAVEPELLQLKLLPPEDCPCIKNLYSCFEPSALSGV